ncbi:tRNA epoxyqueuosine(34) reductase QueG [Thermanaeromonas sp. C210]|uniref:tRNA epoxyqueuosine(34) reductase QueG n=1 Tax=Thermanaeromonas sp. C210 TaxID=2731925 RepID=UPI00155BE4E2|nr:tRNA epoxyqueuosine(34) reductase QueG [Thermanaeromonas sp. C210]GFN22629.1 4Fe-4S ferredoxin [Thermanaeromonas sp. C210]
MALIEELQQEASRLGLRLGAVPATTVFRRGLDALRHREKEKWETPFVGSSIEARCRPDVLFPGAQTVIVVAHPWYFPAGRPPGPGEGLVAMSCRGEDYHRVLERLLEPLAEWLKERGAAWAVVQVDKGPLIEREAAFVAGLGYYGYNCSLMVPGMGSRVALGLIITDLKLEATPPLKELKCRECGRCLRACPTGALVAPYTLHPGRCLSYLTQKRGFLPPSLRPYLGQRLFGCDVCQDVCPENEGLTLVGTPFIHPGLVRVLTMDGRRFRELFGSTALAWRGKSLLQRNAVIALANTGYKGEEAIKALQKLLSGPSPVLRGHAAWALGKLGLPEGRRALETAYEREQDPFVREEVERALAGEG